MNKGERFLVSITLIIACAALIIGSIALHKSIVNKNNAVTTTNGSSSPTGGGMASPTGGGMVSRTPIHEASPGGMQWPSANPGGIVMASPGAPINEAFK